MACSRPSDKKREKEMDGWAHNQRKRQVLDYLSAASSVELLAEAET